VAASPFRFASIAILLSTLVASLAAGCAKSERPSEGEHPRSAKAGTIFSDEALARGLDFTHFSGACGKLYLAEMMGSGVGLLDFDNDGDLDSYIVQGGYLDPSEVGCDAVFPPTPEMYPLRDRLFRNELDPAAGPESLRFTDVTAETGIDARGYGMGVTTGDYDNDGWTDLYVTNLGGNHLLHNNGDGTFTDVTRTAGVDDPRWSTSAAFVDLDGDGWLDLYVTNYVDFTVAGRQHCTTLTGAADYCGPLSYRPLSDRLFRNRGDGTFDPLTWGGTVAQHPAAGLGVASGDFDSDGRLDLYVANDGMANFLWSRADDGTLHDVAMLTGSALNREGQAEAGMGVAVADIDADGDEDVLVTHLTLETNTLYRNLGGGLFEDQSTAAGVGAPSWSFTSFGTAWLDYDNDGWLDLITVNGAVKIIQELAAVQDRYPLHMPNQLFHNLGGGRFEEIAESAGEAFTASEVSRGVATGDIDNDGDVDVVLANNSARTRLLLNRGSAENHWIGLRVVEAEGRREALGAWIGIERSTAPAIWRRVRTDGSYLSASDPRLLIGLGSDPSIDRVVVLWPDGSREAFTAPANTYTDIRQGTGEILDG
jgi:hypothetical protein